MEKKEIETKPELVEAKILIPKPALDFLKAAHNFGKWKESLEEYLGLQVLITLDQDLGDLCIPLWDMKEIVKGYGLDKVPELHNLVDCPTDPAQPEAHENEQEKRRA